MKSVYYQIPLILTAVILLQFCTIDSFEQGSSSLTVDESLIAGQIIGESVSENQNGLLSSFSKGFAIPTESNLVEGPTLLSTGTFRDLDNYSYEFIPETGTHKVIFTKQQDNELYNSNSTFTLSYTFFDQNQNYIEFPEQRRNDIEAVEYSATRTGEIETNTKTSYFSRTDMLFIDGISSGSNILTIEGYHSGEGTFSHNRTNGVQAEREYLLDINYLDIRINKPVVQNNRNFRKGVTGALSYESTIRERGNTGTETKIVNGTIELNGDGTALLKFREQIDSFRLRLANGEVFDDDEFEGRVVKVNLQENIFTISNGQRIQINEQTEIEYDDFSSFGEVAAAVEQGVRITSNGDYYHPDENVNLWVATDVEFELESNEFEDLVTSVDLNQHSFTLANGDRFFIIESSEIEFEDEFESLQDVADAVEKGMPVEADGEFFVDIDTGKRMVKDVEFEFEFHEFEEYVTSVDLNENTFTIESGKIVKITEDTVIKDDGDYSTLEEVAESIETGNQVEADGKFYFDRTSGYWIAVELEFED